MKEKILVVDDEQSHRAMLKAVLSKEGYEVSEADDGTSAVKAVENDTFDLILMDIRMTDMDGIEAVGEIKKFSPSIPIIMMTAWNHWFLGVFRPDLFVSSAPPGIYEKNGF